MALTMDPLTSEILMDKNVLTTKNPSKINKYAVSVHQTSGITTANNRFNRATNYPIMAAPIVIHHAPCIIQHHAYETRLLMSTSFLTPGAPYLCEF